MSECDNSWLLIYLPNLLQETDAHFLLLRRIKARCDIRILAIENLVRFLIPYGDSAIQQQEETTIYRLTSSVSSQSVFISQQSQKGLPPTPLCMSPGLYSMAKLRFVFIPLGVLIILPLLCCPWHGRGRHKEWSWCDWRSGVGKPNKSSESDPFIWCKRTTPTWKIQMPSWDDFSTVASPPRLSLESKCGGCGNQNKMLAPKWLQNWKCSTPTNQPCIYRL